jgi:excisionase family DNA binding protein
MIRPNSHAAEKWAARGRKKNSEASLLQRIESSSNTFWRDGKTWVEVPEVLMHELLEGKVRKAIPDSSREVMNVEDAALLLDVSVWTIRDMAHYGKLPARKVGRAWRFSRQALLQWLKVEEVEQ